MSKVELTFHGPSATPLSSLCSSHLSGIMNGLTQVSAFAGDASAVPAAPLSAGGPPNLPRRSVGTGLPRAVVRNTFTATRVGFPAGSFGNVTSAGSTDGAASATRFFCAVLTALVTAGPVDVRSLEVGETKAGGPGGAPASAGFWGRERPLIIHPAAVPVGRAAGEPPPPAQTRDE